MSDQLLLFDEIEISSPVQFYRVTPVIDVAVRGLCSHPYPGHPRGCPNFNHADRCPPAAPVWGRVYQIADTWAGVYTFDMAEHRRVMAGRHPDWTERQQRNPLYWQAHARVEFRRELDRFIQAHPGYRYEMTPEAMGVNVFATMSAVGIQLGRNPRDTVRLVALIAKPLEV
jgi:hypothetical protein